MLLVFAAQLEYHVCAIDIWRTDVLDAIMEVDGNCNIKNANTNACTMFGYPTAGMKTLNLSRLFQLAGMLLKGNVPVVSDCQQQCGMQTSLVTMQTYCYAANTKQTTVLDQLLPTVAASTCMGDDFSMCVNT